MCKKYAKNLQVSKKCCTFALILHKDILPDLKQELMALKI